MKKIKLVGIRGDEKYESWRRNTKQVLAELKLESRLEEVNQVDAILGFSISAVPALIINNTILLEQNLHIPGVAEIKDVILNYLNQEKMKMENIVVPTDFSVPAHNAYLYARDLAEFVGGQVKVVHACYPDRNSISGLTIPSVEELLENKRHLLDTFVQDDQPGSIEGVVAKEMVGKEVIVGFPKEEIIKLSSQKEVDVILMGTTGSGDLLNKFFGSVSSEVSQKAHCPVWLVPPNTSFNGIKNILYAGNYESADGRMLREVSELAARFEANIHMVHVSKKKNFEENKIQELISERLFNKLAPNLKFKMGTVVSEKVWEGLDLYTQENNIDLIVVVTKHRSFWEGLRTKSITKEMVFHTKVPLLILHLDD
ncbi:MAG: nucleotide-binding universal stress UspA family protein [Saprospiraceae bacterium]|jgi:nucleotide-binding universal stress UspA family protein